MIFLVAATYVILMGLIAYLLAALHSRRTECAAEIRDTALDAEELQKHAAEIARNHPVGRPSKNLNWLVRRLNDNYNLITGVYRSLNKDIRESFPTAPSAEWLLDNFYIIEEQFRLIRKNLSRGRYSRLPVLKKGYLKGYPRVYAIALEIVAHSTGSIDEKSITTFIQAYQSQSLLSMSELWAVPLMLRIALIESIRNTCETIKASRQEWHRAEALLPKISEAGSDERQIDLILDRELGGNVGSITPSFAEHLTRRLRKQGKMLSVVTALLDQRLKGESASTAELTAAEHQIQAEIQVAIGNSITGLRLISELDWSDIFEMLSKTEQILRRDPDGVYARMDFESRDYYRHEVEKLARAFGLTEIQVAERAVSCAEGGGDSSPKNHVGFYLVGKGRKILLEQIGKTSVKKWRLSFTRCEKPKSVYITVALFLTVFLVTYFMYYTGTHDGTSSIFWPILTAVLVFIPCSELGISLSNTIISHIYSPVMLPKLELKSGIPEDMTTFVIVPALLTSPARARELVMQMEVHYLANREANLYFALVGDFKDADSEKTESDDEISEAALKAVEWLNAKYSSGNAPVFYYVHRSRKYNESQRRWMGWERKRGAIVEFNKLLRGDGNTGFSIISGDISALPYVKYVITLDADTSLPMGTAKKLIGTMAHPLNRAVFNESTGIVSEGHGILQPRISVSIPGANRSLFTRIFAGQGGIDPYTTAVSDIYQDLFDEGIFTGKGIYDVDVFTLSLHDRIPDNAVLSHDLLEGCYLRAGLVSDIELVDGYPGSYISYAARLHRWVRGDWQLLPWLGSRVRDRSGAKVKNNISALSKWKILDNLRRSLLYPSLFLLYLSGIILLPGNAYVWVGLAVFTTASPLINSLVNSLLAGSSHIRGNRSNTTVISGIKAAVYQSLLLFVLIPHQTYIMLDAAVRTVYRVYFSHSNMLEWVTAADAEARAVNNARGYYRKMWFSLPSAAVMLLLSLTNRNGAVFAAAAASAAWLAAPAGAYYISRPSAEKKSRLTEEDEEMLRRISRKTWRYFEDFSSESENYLPPDNYQLDPPKGTAHRTSPTNIGLLLLSVLSARDMGYMGADGMAARLDMIIGTMQRLERWKGHFYNWYDTVTLETLRPLYVSTVDSGNLVGYMMVLREGLKEYPDRKLPDAAMASGLNDTIGLYGGGYRDERLKDLAAAEAIDIREWEICLAGLSSWLEQRLSEEGSDPDGWGGKLSEMIKEFMDELYSYYPILKNADLADILKSCDPGHAEAMYSAASPAELITRYKRAVEMLVSTPGEDKQPAGRAIDPARRDEMLSSLRQAIGHIDMMTGKYRDLADRISSFIDETEFSPLFDRKRLLFSIGYNVEDGHLSKSYYDLLASEARQASFIAIARGEADRRHWVRLGRKLAASDGGMGLVSWTGTMFEYLMPLLIMRNYENTILDETYSFVVKKQKKYGKSRGIPWGISESGYSALDFSLNYQYKAFGVPELGLKRGLANDMVTAPYASLLAVGIDPVSVAENLKELQRLGMEGTCGFYEAIDFTPTRLDADSKYSIVRSYMAHHQGMSLAAMNNFFNSDILQKRFHNIPVVRSAELLLQEKVTGRVIYTKEYKEESVIRTRKNDFADGEAYRTYGIPKTLPPNVHILTNGDYSVMITDGGSGFSKAGDFAVNRWTPDYFDKKGFYIFIENINCNMAWSATYEPYGQDPDKYKVVFSPDKAQFTRRNGNIESHLEITVSSEDRAEVRRLSLTNHSEHSRVVELTSYFEVVLAPEREDASHPAFSKLFVRTEYDREHKCLLASRRQRKEGQEQLWLVHTMAVENGQTIGDVQFETDRMKFIGRNRDITYPEAMDPDQPLSGSQGSVLDPVMSLRRRIRIEPGCTVRVVYAVALAGSRKNAVELAEKYNDFRVSERAFELSWTRSRVESRYLGLPPEEAAAYLDMAPFLLYGSSIKKDYSSYIAKNSGSQKDLWPFGISGDLPVILAVVSDSEDIDIADWILKGHEYLRMKNLYTDLVILINRTEGYDQPLNDKVRDSIASSHARELVNKRGGIFVINLSDISPQQVSLLYTAARLIVRDSIESFKRSLKESRTGTDVLNVASACHDYDKPYRVTVYDRPAERRLLFFNGIGGFSEDGREYVIKLENGRRTPLPWTNVIASRNFGFLVTESGGGYTWFRNSREFKLTPWSNDPVTDRPGEIFYISDIEEKCHWSLTPMPIAGNGPYTVRHGRGYTVFEHESSGIRQSLTVFAALDQPVKICIISLRNQTGRQRKLKITYYIRPVLGVDDSITSHYILTRTDENGLLFIENTFSQDFRGRNAFLAASGKNLSCTGDRASFIGSRGDLTEPAGLSGESLTGTVGAGVDPCAAVSCLAEPAPEEEAVIVFLLGTGNDDAHAQQMAEIFLKTENALYELERVKSFWREKLETIQLHTPDDSFDMMMNGWLLYQVTACRLWARSGYYQAGGAYGFRDQLQDCMALLVIWPEISREQILLHASRQFIEGDVQHWWHAERGNGIRTRYSDDLLWLAYVTAEYLEKTGDTAVLDEVVPFLEGNLLGDGEDEKYEEPHISGHSASLYEHCVLAIEKSLETGPHGLPLIGGGDWNDGMNTVGHKGLGESVWLGWFLLSILNRFTPVCRLRNDHARAELFSSKAAELTKNMEKNAWDGSWYRRAYFDDGTPLGSAANSECMIDSISQSWSVISGAAKQERAREAMAAVQRYLVDADERIVRLLTPPFSDGALQPGYIKGYVPGVRENGGQYTHAAAWVVLAYTRLGMGDKAGEIFHMLNPINHTRTDIEYSRYKTEPYVMAADVYAVSPHAGRGGWTWYTGAAGWLYTVGLESMAGFVKKGDKLYIDPCIPSSWKSFKIIYRYGSSEFHIMIKNPDGVNRGISYISADGAVCAEGCIDLSSPGRHNVEVVMGLPFCDHQTPG